MLSSDPESLFLFFLLFLFFFFSPSKKPNQSGSDPPAVLRGVWLHAKTETRVPTSPPPPPPPLLPPSSSVRPVRLHARRSCFHLARTRARSLAAAPRRVHARQTERRRAGAAAAVRSPASAPAFHTSPPLMEPFQPHFTCTYLVPRGEKKKKWRETDSSQDGNIYFKVI